MATVDFVIKKGDVRPVLSSTLTYADGTTVNLTGASVRFVMRAQTAIAPTTNAAATIVTPTAPAVVSYAFTLADSAVTGRFMGEWHVTFADTSLMTFPSDGYLEIVVEEDLVTAGGARLVGLGEVKDHLRIPNSDRTRDTRLLEMIDSAAPIVENLVGPVLQRQVVETYDGGSWFISLRFRPVLSVQSVIEYRGPIAYDLTQVANPALGTIYSYMFQPPGRIVRRTVGGGQTQFPPGADTVFVTYISGMLKTPAHIREATLEMIRENFQQTEQRGRRSNPLSVDDQDPSISMPLTAMYASPRVRSLLTPSRRHPSVA